MASTSLGRDAACRFSLATSWQRLPVVAHLAPNLLQQSGGLGPQKVRKVRPPAERRMKNAGGGRTDQAGKERK